MEEYTGASAIAGKHYRIGIDDEMYPSALREIEYPPESIYVIGNVEVLSKPGIAMAGARKVSEYGAEQASNFARIAAQVGIPVISGGARGCDTFAHDAAVQAGGETVAVLFGGANVPYPEENTELFKAIVDSGGALISEDPWGYPPIPHNATSRNRIIAGLSSAVFVIEAGLPSGMFSLAEEAAVFGKEVMALPGDITRPSAAGTNMLISQGATPVVSEESFYEAIERIFS